MHMQDDARNPSIDRVLRADPLYERRAALRDRAAALDYPALESPWRDRVVLQTEDRTGKSVSVVALDRPRVIGPGPAGWGYDLWSARPELLDWIDAALAALEARDDERGPDAAPPR